MLWAEERLGDTLWSAQKRILNALRDHRQVAVMSCHEIGKSYISAVATGWWIDVHPPGSAFVVTSAPSAPQVRTVLWREISRVHTRGKLPGRVNQTEWLLPIGDKEEQVAIGRKPNDYDFTAFQGMHARYFMYIFDEACGMPHDLWEAADSLIANDRGRALAFGNPDDPNSEFANICKPGSGWHVIQIGAFDTPEFTGEPFPQHIKENLIGRLYIESKRRKWAPNWFWVDRDGISSDAEQGVRVIPPEGVDIAESGAFWQSKVLGLFPSNTEEGGLIPLQWIRKAMDRDLEPVGPSELGLDVGGGGDASCAAHRHGPVVRIKWQDFNPDTMATCGKLIRYMQENAVEKAKVDMIGIGRGVVDRARELKGSYPGEVQGIDVGKAPYEQKVNPKKPKQAEEEEEGFFNLRAYLWWHLRKLFESGLIDIDQKDEDLAQELGAIRYKRMSNNKIQIESKADAKKRGIPSPNRAEAVMLSFAPPKPKQTRAIWGSRRFKAA